VLYGVAVIGREHLFKMFTMLRETHLWSVDPVYGAVQLLLDQMEEMSEGPLGMLDSPGIRIGNLVVLMTWSWVYSCSQTMPIRVCETLV